MHFGNTLFPKRSSFSLITVENGRKQEEHIYGRHLFFYNYFQQYNNKC